MIVTRTRRAAAGGGEAAVPVNGELTTQTGGCGSGPRPQGLSGALVLPVGLDAELGEQALTGAG